MTRQDTLILKGGGIIALLIWHLFSIPFFKICVAVFVFSSGYGMGVGLNQVMKKVSSDDKIHTLFDYAKFILKRLVKFYINYWSIFLLFVPLSIFVFGKSLDDAYGASGGVRMIADFFCVGNYNYNVAWWFNTMILILYLISPFIFFLLKETPIITILGFLFLTKYALYDNYFPYIPEHLFLFQVYQLNMYLFVFVLAMAFAMHRDKITLLESKVKRDKMLLFIYGLLIVFFCFLHETSWMPFFRGWRVEAFILLFLSLFVSHISSKIKYLNEVFIFCGKHSANIYLFHNFVILWWLKEYLFKLEYQSLILIVSLVICLLISIIIEQIKKMIGVYKVEQSIIECIK